MRPRRHLVIALALPGLAHCAKLVAEGTDGLDEGNLHDMLRPPTWLAAFPLEVSAVWVEDPAGNSKSQTRFEPTDFGLPPRRLFNPWATKQSAFRFNMYAHTTEYIAKVWAHPHCDPTTSPTSGPVPRMEMGDEDFLVFELRWPLGAQLPESFELPVHVHADYPWVGPTDITVHNEVLPTNVWQRPDLQCPIAVGRRIAEKNLCKFSSLLASDDATGTAEDDSGVGCNSHWDNVICPVDDSMLQAGTANCSNPASVLVKFTYADGSLAARPFPLRTPEAQLEEALDTKLYARSSSAVCLNQASHESGRSASASSGVSEADCTPGRKFCEHGKPCLTDVAKPLRVRISATELKSFRSKVGDPFDHSPVGSLSDIQYVGFQLHDNHGADGDSLDSGPRMFAPGARVYVALQQEGDESSGLRPTCPDEDTDNIPTSFPEAEFRGLLPEESCPARPSGFAGMPLAERATLRDGVMLHVFKDLVCAASTYSDHTVSFEVSKFMRLSAMLGNGEVALKLRKAGWQQLRVFLDSQSWSPQLFIGACPAIAQPVPYIDCIAALMKQCVVGFDLEAAAADASKRPPEKKIREDLAEVLPHPEQLPALAEENHMLQIRSVFADKLAAVAHP